MANPKIQLRHDTKANWETKNPVLLEGEVAIETDTNKQKVGNGTDAYKDLPYIVEPVEYKTPLVYTGAHEVSDNFKGTIETEPGSGAYYFNPDITFEGYMNGGLVINSNYSLQSIADGDYPAYVDVPIERGTLVRTPISPSNSAAYPLQILIGNKDTDGKFTPYFVVCTDAKESLYAIGQATVRENNSVFFQDIGGVSSDWNNYDIHTIITAPFMFGVALSNTSNKITTLTSGNASYYEFTGVPVATHINKINTVRFCGVPSFHNITALFGKGWFGKWNIPTGDLSTSPADTLVEIPLNEVFSPTKIPNTVGLDIDTNTLGVQNGKLTVVNGDPGGTLNTRIDGAYTMIAQNESNIVDLTNTKQNKLVAGDNIKLVDNTADGTTTISTTGGGGINNPPYPTTTPASGDQTTVTDIAYDYNTHQLRVGYDYKHYEGGFEEDSGHSTLIYPTPVEIANTDLSNLSKVANNNMFINTMPDYTAGIAISAIPYTAPKDGYISFNITANSTAYAQIDNLVAATLEKRGNTNSTGIVFIPIKEGQIFNVSNNTSLGTAKHNFFFPLLGGN